MSDPKKWIIDTNVIVHWLMASQVMGFAVKKFHLPDEFLSAYQNQNQNSIDFVNNALKTARDKHDFLIVELSLSEIFSGVRDEVRSILLFSKRVSLSRLAYMRESKEASFSEELSMSVYESTLKGFDTLLGTNEMGIIPVTSPSGEDTYFEVYSSLVFLYPSLRTQDAILVTTGIFEKADYFVTIDNALIKLGKDKKFKNRYTMQITTPLQASHILGE